MNYITHEKIFQAYRNSDKRLHTAFELWRWQRDIRADNFTVLLFHLIAKADKQNREALFTAFPDEVICFLDWQAADSSDEFFKREGVHPA